MKAVETGNSANEFDNDVGTPPKYILPFNSTLGAKPVTSCSVIDILSTCNLILEIRNQRS